MSENTSFKEATAITTDSAIKKIMRDLTGEGVKKEIHVPFIFGCNSYERIRQPDETFTSGSLAVEAFVELVEFEELGSPDCLTSRKFFKKKYNEVYTPAFEIIEQGAANPGKTFEYSEGFPMGLKKISRLVDSSDDTTLKTANIIEISVECDQIDLTGLNNYPKWRKLINTIKNDFDLDYGYGKFNKGRVVFQSSTTKTKDVETTITNVWKASNIVYELLEEETTSLLDKYLSLR